MQFKYVIRDWCPRCLNYTDHRVMRTLNNNGEATTCNHCTHFTLYH